MPNPNTAATARENRLIEPNAENHYTVSRADLPLHCPMEGMSLWNSHPRVYLAIEETGHAKCPYCGRRSCVTVKNRRYNPVYLIHTP